MNGSLLQILWVGLGLAIGSVVTWAFAKSRQREAIALAETAAQQAAAALQIDLSSMRERAARVPDLERDLSQTNQTLNLANQRKAALESEVLRLPDLESRLSQANGALDLARRDGTELQALNSRLKAELTAERENLQAEHRRLTEVQLRCDAKTDEARSLAVDVARLTRSLESEQKGAQEKLDTLLNAREALTDQFKTLANDILEEKSKRFTEQNQSNLGALLDPLKVRINEFQTKIEDTYIKEGNARTALGVELGHLKELNQQLSEDAKNLTRAL